jgi:predicted small secreted protein
MNRWILFILIIASLTLSACGAPEQGAGEKISPSKLEPIEGTDLSKVILTEKAAERIDIQTVQPSGNQIPYAAVIYDIEGNTWVYTNPEPLVFVREPIEVDSIEGDMAILSKALEANTAVVTVGVAELWGTETGVSK